jgi:glycosyltransferase involved in cell wall biosynthesis
MNILFLSSGDHVPSARFRILPYLSFFRADGHRCTLASSFPQKYDYFPWMGFRPSQLLKRSVRWWHWLKASVSRYDLVFIDREIFDDGTTAMEERFRDVCGHLILDLDDAVFLRQSEKFDRLLPTADLVVCGNRFLQEKVEPLNAATLHIPTCVSMNDYDLRSVGDDSARPVVGWMGTTGNLKYLEVAAEALRAVAAEIDFELRIVVPDIQPLEKIDLAGVHVVHDPWQPKNEVAQLQQMDVGLMPLFPDQEWDVYKCGLKLIQYLAVGVPGIAAPVGVNSEILSGNQNGLCAESPAEWEEALRTMLGDASNRREMGIRGRQTVQDRYSIQANYPILRDALLEVCAK